MYKVNLPIRVQLTKKTYFSINLNSYRNAHYQTLNKAKIIFKEMISPFLGSVPFINSCKLIYVLFPKSKHLQDVSNICSVADKFFCDAMTELGKWSDDNYTVVKEVTYRFGAVDKDNPRVEVYILEENDPMQIKLIEKEIVEAIQYYIINNIGLQLPEGKEFKVSMTATRGSSGVTADIDLVSKELSCDCSKRETVEPQLKESIVEDEEPPFDSPVSEPTEKTKAPSLFSGLTRPTNK